MCASWRLIPIAAFAGLILVMGSSMGGTPASRPIIVFASIHRQSGQIDEFGAQIDKGSGRVFDWIDFNCPPRWQPRGLHVAGWYSPGVYVSRYLPAKRRFTGIEPIARVFASKGVSYQVGTGSQWPMLAWSPDGKSLLLDEGSLVALDLASGKRKTIVPWKRLIVKPDDEIRGMDWSLDGKWIAYSVPGRDPAPIGTFDTEAPRKKDSGVYCDVWLVRADGSQRRRLGHGSRPRFSPNGDELLVLDRLSDRFGTCLRTYDLRAARPLARLLISDARAGSYAGSKDRFAVALANADLVLADRKGQVTSKLTTIRDVMRGVRMPAEVNEALEVRRVDLDW